MGSLQLPPPALQWEVVGERTGGGGAPLGLGREGVRPTTCLASVSPSPTERLSLGLPPLHPPSCLRALVLPWVVADRGGSPGLIVVTLSPPTWLPYLANKNAGHQVKFEFQLNNQ